MEVGHACEFVGERLIDSNLRKRYGVNIASIQRGAKMIPIPKGDTRIFPGDVLGVIGSDEQIQRLLPVVEAREEEQQAPVNANNFKLTNVQLSESSPLLGHTSASASLRNKYMALVVAIQRGDEYLKPNGEVEFQPNDIVWLVGDVKKLTELK
jgi:CPA2 family monovalent cation:H+ antiporter-2